MSYREIRNLTEHLKSLGFPRTISMENFSTPNFPLLTEIIIWTMKMVDSEVDISGVIDTEHDRVLLIRIASVFYYQKLGVKLNTVRLYGADKLAVRELLKITTCIYQATQTALRPPNDDGGGELEEGGLAVNISGKDLREVRQLASGIVVDAASLHDRLNREVDAKIKREATLNRAFDIDKLEATLVSALHALSGTIEDIKDATEQMEKQELEIEEKLQKKKESLARNRKRLEALNKIKPNWQSEFEEEELKLRSAWDVYIIKHKNLSYLEEQLEHMDEQQQQQLNAAIQRGLVAAASNSDNADDRKEQSLSRNRRIFGTMTGENVDSTDTESTDSFLNDSVSDDDDLTFLSKNDVELDEACGLAAQKRDEPLGKYELYPKTASQMASNIESHGRPSSARPKSAHIEARVSALNNWTNNVKGSERVSPLSASEDNSDGF